MVDGVVRPVTARLIVGADGRDSQVARLGGFERRVDPDELLAAGLLVEGEMDTGMLPTCSSAKLVARSPWSLGSQPVSTGSTSSIMSTRSPTASGLRDVETILSHMRDAGVPNEWRLPSDYPTSMISGIRSGYVNAPAQVCRNAP